MFTLSWIKYLLVGRSVWWKSWFGLSLFLALGGGVAYYKFSLPVNFIFLLGYLSALVALLSLGKPQLPSRQTWLFILGVTVIYTALHLPVFAHAPWNENGIFDDAAWDIFLMKRHLGVHPWQSLHFDSIGMIDREYIFHTVMYVWFSIFGYSLKVFNYGLLFLGGVTVVFAALVVRIYFSSRVALIASIIMTMQPFHYTHQFIGHRYAIALPLLAILFYFLAALEKCYTEKLGALPETVTNNDAAIHQAQQRLNWYGVWSIILLGVTVMSSIMGRQVLYTIVAVVGIQIIIWGWPWVKNNKAHVLAWIKAPFRSKWNFPKLKTKWKALPAKLSGPAFRQTWKEFWGKAKSLLAPWVIWGVLLAIVLLPHLLYVGGKHGFYLTREHDLMRGFFTHPDLWWRRIVQTLQMLFMPILGHKEFSRFSLDAALMPVWIWPLWIVGLYNVFKQQRYFLLILNFIAAVGSCVAGPYDFRFFFSVPAWMITFGCGLGVISKGTWIRDWWRLALARDKVKFVIILVLILVVIAALGLWGNHRFREHLQGMYLAGGLWGGMLLFLLTVGIGLWYSHRKQNISRLRFWQGIGTVGSLIIVLVGLIVTGKNLAVLEGKPREIHALQHVDVGRARMMQDMLRGRSFVDASFHDKDELRPPPLELPNTRVAICSIAYGVIHMFLRDPNQNDAIFGLCQGPMSVLRWHEVWKHNRHFWSHLSPRNESRYLFMWDLTEEQAALYSFLRQLNPPGELKVLNSTVDGSKVRIFYLAQTAEEFRQWQRQLRFIRDPKSAPKK